MTIQKLSSFVSVASVAAATLLCSHQASAQSAGQWMLQGGFTTISPHVDSG
ncbi:MAG: OmpW family protein, partial [Rubrivivax sp.]